MEAWEYNKLSTEKHGGVWAIPAELLDEDGGLDPDHAIEVLTKADLIGYSLEGRIILTDKLKQLMPDVHKLIHTILRDYEQAKMDKLVEKGVAEQFINNDAELEYRLSDGSLLMNSRGMLD